MPPNAPAVSRAAAQRRVRCGERRRIAIPDRDARSTAGETLCDGKPDACRSAGNDRTPVAKIELIHARSSRVGATSPGADRTA